MLSSDNSIKVVFQTDSSEGGAGWELMWTGKSHAISLTVPSQQYVR